MDGKVKRGKGLYRNWISYLGALGVLGSVLLITGSLIAVFSFHSPSPYIGIFTYMVFPGFLMAGIVLFLYGMRHESLRRRRAKTTEAQPFPKVDLNDPRTRRRFVYWLVGGGFLMVLMAFVGYNAFLYTESVEFCGTVCHTVMEPEHVARMEGPHARVRCVDCHVGAGVSWYVKSKMSGLYQVYAVATGDYERPIPVPVKNLRPARETCEECHWPNKFFGAQLQQNPHFRYDEANTPEQVSLLVKTGGGTPNLGQKAGIHWHMVVNNVVEYVANDENLQDIPWVRVTHGDGTVKEYVDTKSKLAAADIEAKAKHRVDCMDCHNRPSHVFVPPETAVDKAGESGRIPMTLPWVKKLAVDALVAEYPDKQGAHEGIRLAFTTYYGDRYPEVLKARADDIAQAVDTVTAIYDRNVFPAMNVNWKTYASNIGHRNWKGCFRCHDKDHVTKDGEVLSADCTLCHTLPQRGPLMPLGSLAPASDQNWHPWELKGKHAEILCTRCHEAGYRPPTECVDCHKMDRKAPMMADGCDSCHATPGVRKPVADCKDCHDSLGELHKKETHGATECTVCHKPHVWKVPARETCQGCHEDRKAHYPDEPCAKCHAFKAKGS